MSLLRPLLDVLFPPLCLLCGEISIGFHPHCCPGCLSSFRSLSANACLRCGEPFSHDDTPHLCLACLAAPPPSTWGRSLYAYEGSMRRALAHLKYGRRLSLLGPLREALLEGAGRASLPPFDLVVPVPLSPWGAARRTFNQSVLLAAPLAERWGVPLVTDALGRRAGPANAGLSREERNRNARRGFFAGRGVGKGEGKRVLLFDDVTTTGATVRACAALLARAGAEPLVLTLARTEHVRQGGVKQAVAGEGG